MSHHPQRLDLAFKIKWQAGWHVGSGLSSAAIDRLQRRRVCGKRAALAAFVPGSQIKGVLRHHCERLAATLGAVPVSPHVVGDPRPEILDNFCPLDQSKLLIDRLFGNRFQGECLFVDDATPCDDKPQYSSPQSRTSIDRVTGTARDQTLFVTEVVAPQEDLELTSNLRARHAPGVLTQDGDGFPLEYALLIAGLVSLDALGGSKSTGLGKCALEIVDDSVRWNGKHQVSVSEALKSLEDPDWYDIVELIREEGQA
jgi:CRISPR/Cas system CSM-associated protein Csm3 (group 7 of RAMP superfamily)